MAYEPTTIANYFIQDKSSLGKLTPMKIIKLTYLSYCWYLALTNSKESLLNERPQAWEFGVMFPNLYYRMKEYGSSNIQSKLITFNEEVITKEISKFLDKIWDIYGDYTGIELSALTSTDNTPYRTSYNPKRNKVISDKTILEYYLPKLKQS